VNVPLPIDGSEQSVLHDAPVPVLLVKEPEAPDEEFAASLPSAGIEP
jgi:hypothetical protein